MSILNDLIDELKRQSHSFSAKKDLQNINWIRFDDDGSYEEKVLYRFKPKGDLIISSSGNISNGKWELLDDNTLVISESEQNSTLFRLFKYQAEILFLNQDGTDKVYCLINENFIEKVGESIIDYLEGKLRKSSTQQSGDTNQVSQDRHFNELSDSDTRAVIFIVSVIVILISLVLYFVNS